MIHNSEELKTVLLPKVKAAVKQTQEQVYMIVNRFVKEWYSEFSPEMYVRTYQLYQSLVKSEIIEIPNGYRAEVYFDLDRLDYYLKTIRYSNGRTRQIKNYWKGGVSGASTLTEKIAGAVIGGNGYHVLRPQSKMKKGTAIWKESIAALNKDGYRILVNNLKAAGVPLKTGGYL